MDGLKSYEVITRSLDAFEAKRLAAWGGWIARPMAGDPVTGKSTGKWEVVKFDEEEKEAA